MRCQLLAEGPCERAAEAADIFTNFQEVEGFRCGIAQIYSDADRRKFFREPWVPNIVN